MRRTPISWNLKQLRPHIPSCSVSPYTSVVLKARCIANDVSHPVKGNHMMVDLKEVASHAAFQHMPSNIDRGIPHIQEIKYSCSLYASTPSFKSQVISMKIVKYIRLLSTMTGTAKAKCWSCGRSKSEKGFLICPSCNAIQAPDPDITYFDIFDQDQKFELDLKDLETKYKSLMKRLHPDLTHGKSTEEKDNHAQWSALVTTAYTDLLQPVSRATYLLKLQGICVEEEGTVTDSELIMEVMEIKETLQSKPDRKTLEELNKQATARMSEWSCAFTTALEEGNDSAAVGALQRMSYFGRVCDDINRELL